RRRRAAGARPGAARLAAAALRPGRSRPGNAAVHQAVRRPPAGGAGPLPAGPRVAGRETVGEGGAVLETDAGGPQRGPPRVGGAAVQPRGLLLEPGAPRRRGPGLGAGA